MGTQRELRRTIADPKRPWEGPWEQCCGKCAGHYLRSEDHYHHYQVHGREEMKCKPPSVVIAEVHKNAERERCNLTSEEIERLAKETLLTVKDVQIWLQHPSVYRKNFVGGAELYLP